VQGYATGSTVLEPPLKETGLPERGGPLTRRRVMKATTLERMPPHALKRIAKLERQLRLELRRSDNTCVTMEQVLTSLRAENKALREMLKPHYSDWRIDDALEKGDG
jgi:hypothetical protein